MGLQIQPDVPDHHLLELRLLHSHFALALPARTVRIEPKTPSFAPNPTESALALFLAFH